MDGVIYIGVDSVDKMRKEIVAIIATCILPNPQEFIQVGSLCEDGKSEITVSVRKGNAL